MDTRHLREFTLLARLGNLSEAAIKLSISQSSLSKHMKSLEEELGAPLFHRTGKGVVLNEYGKILLPCAKQMVMLEDHYTRDVYNKRHDADHIIVIGTEYRITNLLTDFRTKNKDYLLSCIEGSEARRLLRAGECELAFIVDLEDPEGEFVSFPYATDAFVVVLYASHPLAGRATVSLQELRDEDFVMFPPYADPSDVHRDMCQRAGFAPKVVMTAPRGIEIVDLVREEMGISLLLRRSVAAMRPEGVVSVEITPSMPINVSICCRRDAHLSSGAKLFLEYVQRLNR